MAFVACVGEASAATIRINSPRINLELAAGESQSGEIVVENPTEEAVKVRAYLEDWIYSTGGTGEKTFSPAGSAPRSCSSWIAFSPANMEIPPFGRSIVRYTVTVPQTAVGGYNSVLFFETIIGTAKDEEGVNIVVSGRIGSLFFIEVKNTVERQGVVESLEVKPGSESKPTVLSTRFRNTGNVDVMLAGSFLVMDAEGHVKGRGQLQPIYTLPGQTEARDSEWVGRLTSGKYQLLVTYDLGKGKNLVEEKTFSI